MTAEKLLNKQTQEMCDYITSIARRIKDFAGAEAQVSSNDMPTDLDTVVSAHENLSRILGELSYIERKYLKN